MAGPVRQSATLTIDTNLPYGRLTSISFHLPPDSSGAMIGFYLHQHLLEKAELTVVYGR
jgi:hypothetical protein